jgi:hypothetical protein
MEHRPTRLENFGADLLVEESTMDIKQASGFRPMTAAAEFMVSLIVVIFCY